MAKYTQVTEGEDGWSETQYPIMRGYKMSCCDCGLVHDIDFEVFEIERFNKNGTFRGKEKRGKRWRVGMRVRRNNRSTGQIRRHQK